MNFTIEKAGVEDAKRILEIQSLGWMQTYPNLDQGITKEEIEEKTKSFSTEKEILKLQKKIKDPNRVFLVAKKEGKIVGFCYARKKKSSARIIKFYVAGPHQGEGIGKRLLQKIISLLGDRSISLQVVDYNKKAREFYKRQGFFEKGKGKPLTLVSGKKISTIEMILR